MTDLPQGAHRRRDPLSGRWVVVSPQRLRRPWLGDATAPDAPGPSYDPHCALCPGNKRATGIINPGYEGAFSFINDFAALEAETLAAQAPCADPLFQTESAQGECRVVCFSPDHAKTLPELSIDEVRSVVALWRSEAAALSRRHRHVQIFENKGAMMGCSNPHPHSQLWASSFVPTEVDLEDRHQRAYFDRRGAAMLGDVVATERKTGERVVLETEYFLAIVPFWAAWPFETLVIATAPVARFGDLDDGVAGDLATMLHQLTTRYDNLFGCSFPYSMGFHGAPGDGGATKGATKGATNGGAPHWRLHAHFYPPLLRSASVRKFMVGYEMLAEAQRDLTPEAAAERLRAQSDIHYRTAGSQS